MAEEAWDKFILKLCVDADSKGDGKPSTTLHPTTARFRQATAVLPSTRITKRIVTMKTLFKVIFAAIALYILFPTIIAPLINPPSQSHYSQTSTNIINPNPINVNIDEMSATYRANEIAADSSYKGKLVRISGTIEEIAKDMLGSPYVILKTQTPGGLRIQCVFAKGLESALISLRPGHSVTISGIVSGKMINIILNNCQIL